MIKLFFAMITPARQIFQVTQGDSWDPARSIETDWKLDSLLNDEDVWAKSFNRAPGPLAHLVAIRNGPLGEDDFAKGGLGMHPKPEGWRELAIEAEAIQDAVKTAVEFLAWEKLQ